MRATAYQFHTTILDRRGRSDVLPGQPGGVSSWLLRRPIAQGRETTGTLSRMGGLGDDTRKNLWLPQDLICLQHVGFDNTYDMTSRTLPTRHPIVLRQQQKIQADNTYKEALCRSVPLWTNPPTVIQIQIDETGKRDQRPHPKPNLGRLREHSGLDDQSNDEKHLECREEIMTENTGPGDPQDKRGRARSPHSNDEEDLRNAALRSWNPKRTDRA
jgi:hypothetical protein